MELERAHRRDALRRDSLRSANTAGVEPTAPSILDDIVNFFTDPSPTSSTRPSRDDISSRASTPSHSIIPSASADNLPRLAATDLTQQRSQSDAFLAETIFRGGRDSDGSMAWPATSERPAPPESASSSIFDWLFSSEEPPPRRRRRDTPPPVSGVGFDWSPPPPVDVTPSDSEDDDDDDDLIHGGVYRHPDFTVRRRWSVTAAMAAAAEREDGLRVPSNGGGGGGGGDSGGSSETSASVDYEEEQKDLEETAATLSALAAAGVLRPGTPINKLPSTTRRKGSGGSRFVCVLSLFVQRLSLGSSAASSRQFHSVSTLVLYGVVQR